MDRQIKRFFYLQKVDQLMRHMGPKVIQKTGMLDGIIIQDWPSIVGHEVANQCIPQKISFPLKSRKNGVLHIGVYDGASGIILQHKSPQILARVNQHYGYAAVHKIVVTGAVPLLSVQKKYKYVAKNLSAVQEKKLTETLKDIPEGSLKEALKNLGSNIY